MTGNRLPATFTSLYRLFLRTSSASVLHHPVAKKNLRCLWRPTFDAAAETIRSFRISQDVAEQARLRDWLNVWERRMDGTLALLYNSSKSRGLSHNLVRNLSFLVFVENKRWLAFRPPPWQPRKSYPPDGPVLGVDLKRIQRQKEQENLKDKGISALIQVAKLAEGRESITLGSVSRTRMEPNLLAE